MPPPLYQGNCNYTPNGTAVGTGTINPGPPAGPAPGQAAPATPGVFYGYTATSTGTAAMGVTVYDVVTVITGTGTVTTTNPLMNGTATAPGQILTPGPAGVGVRYRGALVYITTGTVGGGNFLWD